MLLWRQALLKMTSPAAYGGHAAPESTIPGTESMRTPEEVAAMLELHRKGCGVKRIARELGMARNTVRRYVAAGDWAPYKALRQTSQLQGLESWLAERFTRHRGQRRRDPAGAGGRARHPDRVEKRAAGGRAVAPQVERRAYFRRTRRGGPPETQAAERGDVL